MCFDLFSTGDINFTVQRKMTSTHLNSSYALLEGHRGTCRRSSRERPRGKDQEEKSGSLQEYGRLGRHLCS